MASRTILLGLLILCTSIYVTECKWGRSGGRSGGSRSSGSSWGKGWGSSSSGSSGSSYKPSSSSSGSSWWSSGSSYKPSSSWSSGSSYKPSSSWSTGSSYKPSSSSGSSWWNSGSSYPSSSSGLSGSGSGSSFNLPSFKGLEELGFGSGYNPFGSRKPSYPSSTGLSGSNKPSYPSSTGLSGSNKPSYPSSTGLSGSNKPSYPSSTGLSGSNKPSYPSSTGLSGSNKPSYPSSTGLSGSNKPSYPFGTGLSGTHSYPTGTGLSGSGSGSRYNTGSGISGSGSGTHSYPSGTGLSGSGSGTRYYPSGSGTHNNHGSYRPTNTYNTNTGYHSGSYGTYHPTIYHYPQHVYVTQYRDSGSRYGDLLTGLALYNMGRSHSHYHTDHYYYDDYYRTRYYGSGSSYRPQEQERPKDEAICTLRVVENGKADLLKIPCEIVSTFTEGSQKVSNPGETRLNQTVCTTNTTVIRNTNTTSSPSTADNVTLANVTTNTASVNISNVPAMENISFMVPNGTVVNIPIPQIEGITTVFDPVSPTVANITKPAKISKVLNVTKEEKTEDNKTTSIVRTVTSTETIVNTTVCTTSVGTDPLSVKGPPINPSAMECSVDIKTKDAYFRNKIDCNTLVQYSKKPLTSPKTDSPLLPERKKLESWLNKPPWWMSIFISV